MNTRTLGIDRFKDLLEDDDFCKFLNEYHNGASRVYSASEWAGVVIGVYELKSWLQPVVEHYILNDGAVDASLASDAVVIEQDGLTSTIKLALSPDITQPELVDFITRNWAKNIKPGLDVLSRQRLRASTIARDKRIYRDYTAGRNRTELSADYKLGLSTIDRIIALKKKKS